LREEEKMFNLTNINVMNPMVPINVLKGLTLFGVVKWFAVGGLAMYAFFALIVVKQASIMTSSIEAEGNLAVKSFAYLHLLGAIMLVVAAVVWL
jgi:hypothetical protein